MCRTDLFGSICGPPTLFSRVLYRRVLSFQHKNQDNYKKTTVDISRKEYSNP